MAATLTVQKVVLLQGNVEVIGTCVLDDSYATDGEVLDLSGYISGTPNVIINALSSTYLYRHNGGTAAGGKIIALVLADGTQAGSSSNLSSITANVRAFGSAY